MECVFRKFDTDGDGQIRASSWLCSSRAWATRPPTTRCPT
jgi:hypothetical protein